MSLFWSRQKALGKNKNGGLAAWDPFSVAVLVPQPCCVLTGSTRWFLCAARSCGECYWLRRRCRRIGKDKKKVEEGEIGRQERLRLALGCSNVDSLCKMGPRRRHWRGLVARDAMEP